MSTLRVDNIVPYTSGSTTIVLSGTLETTASYALTASYAMNGGGGGSTGFNVTASGDYSHAEGNSTWASGSYSHAEGQTTVAIGGYSHAEGRDTVAGYRAIQIDSIVDGLITISDDVDYSSAINSGKVVLNGNSVYTYNSTNFSSPDFTIQLDDITVNNGGFVYDIEQPASPLAGYTNNNGGQHAEGVASYAIGNSSHAEGNGTRAIGDYSHAEGFGTQAIGGYSHAAGYQTKAIGGFSQAIGGYSQALGERSNAEGDSTLTGFRGVQPDSCVDGLITISDNVDYSSIFGTGQDRLLTQQNGIQSVDSIAYNAPDFTIQLSDRTINNVGLWVVDINYLNSPLAGYSGTNGGYGAHAEGNGTRALGVASHTEGFGTRAIGGYSHAAGQFTKAIGYASQAIGGYSQALAQYSNAEGEGTIALGVASHTEGNNTIAGYRNLKVTSIVDGLITISNDIDYSSYFNSGRIIYNEELYTYNSINFSSPDFTIQLDDTGINEGEVYIFNPDQPNAQLSGYSEKGGYGGHAEGSSTRALGQNSHAEGFGTKAIGGYSHAEGRLTEAIGQGSHAEGSRTQTFGGYSHAEGRLTTAIGWFSHAEGNRTDAIGIGSHAEGYDTHAEGDWSHTEGIFTSASQDYSHAEGSYTKALGYASHAEGSNTIAFGQGSHTEGVETIASGSYQLAIGGYNAHGDDKSTFIIGGGSISGRRTAARFVQFNPSAEQGLAVSATTGSWVLTQVSESLNFADDSSAAAAGVPLGGLYHDSGTIKIRLV